VPTTGYTKNFVVKNGLTTGNINLYAGNSNIEANTFSGNIVVTNSANLGAVGNITITGGTSGYVLSTNGSGGLSWIAQSGGGSGSPGGSNTYVQYNDSGTFAGSSTFTFDSTTSTLTIANVVVSTTANLGAVGNVTITGGSSGQVLTTNGSGVLSWSTVSQGNVTVDKFTGDGANVDFLLTTTPNSEDYTIVNIDGVMQLHDAYTLADSTVTMSAAPASGASIEITTFVMGGGTGGGGSTNAQDLLSPFLLMGA
jgi:hypothetical protein